MTVPVSPKRTALLAAARERILVLDGAMGTMIQGLAYDEAAFRGERFREFHRDVRGNNDLLILTQPKAIEEIHADYLIACDGGKSTIRRALGVDFVGDSSPEQMLLLGDVEVEGLPDDVWHQWWGDRNALLLCPLVGTRSMRNDTKSVVAGVAGWLGSKNIATIGNAAS